MRLMLVSILVIALSACGGSGGSKLEFNTAPTIEELKSGTANVVVADIEVTKGQASFSATATIGEAVINNNQVRLSVPYQTEERNITVTVIATVSGEQSDQQSFSIRALANDEYSQAKATMQGLKSYFSTPATSSEDYQILTFLLEVSEETGLLSAEEVEQTALWAREYLTDHYLEVAEVVNQDIEALTTATYTIPELDSILQSESNDVLTYMNSLLAQLDIDYSMVTEKAINPDYKSRFYMNEAYGDISPDSFEFRDEFGYMRATPAYIAAKCEGEE